MIMKRMKIVSLETIPATTPEMDGMMGVRKQVPVGNADGTPTMSLRVFTLDPDGYTPYHSHPWEHINYVLEGEGVMVDKDGQEHPIKAGDYALVLPDEMHQFRNPRRAASGGAGALLRFVCLVPREKE